jgi:flagellin-like protein
MKKKMNNTFRKFSHDAKALSPVVASIILIAVTVAVSIAVAAWMGGMTVGFMGTSSLTATDVLFTDDGTDNVIALTLKNTGTKTVTIAAVRVNNQPVAMSTYAAFEPADPGATIVAGNYTTLTISGDIGAWIDGNAYKIDLYDGSNQVIGSTQQNAPGA